MSEQSCGMPEDCICGLCCKHGANKFECVECESARDEVSITPQPDAVEATAEALRLAAMCHGRILLTDPPQDAWKYHGVDEAIRQALAAKESDLRNANPPLANGSRIITAEQWEEYQSLTSENERLREALLDARLVVASQPIDALGTANNGLGAEWPIRDELLSKIDKALTPTEPSKDDLVIEGKDGDLIIPTPEIKE